MKTPRRPRTRIESLALLARDPRPLWLLLPGSRPKLYTEAPASEVALATAYAFDHDERWTPIGTLEPEKSCDPS